MERKALALALITSTATALAACAGGTDDVKAGSADLTSFHAIGTDGSCVSAAPGRQGEFRGGNVRIKFSKGAMGPIATVESYDASTGLLSQKPAEYQYKRVSDGEVELFYIDSGDRMVPYTLKVSGDDVALSVPTFDEPSPVTLKCDLRDGAPGSSLPVAQAAAAPQAITGSFPLPPELNRGGSCVASKLAGNGDVVQLLFRRDGKLSDENMYAHVLVYDAESHLLAGDLLAGTNATFQDKQTSFSLESSKGTYGEITLQNGALVFSPRDEAVKQAIGGDLPLSCDFVGR